MYVSVVTLSTEDNAKLTKQLNEGFKRPVYWNKYKVVDSKVVDIAVANQEKLKLIQVIKESRDSFFLLMIVQMVIMKFLLILSKNSFYQE